MDTSLHYTRVRNILFTTLAARGVEPDTELVYVGYISAPAPCDIYTLQLPTHLVYVFIAQLEEYFCTLWITGNPPHTEILDTQTQDYIAYSVEERNRHALLN